MATTPRPLAFERILNVASGVSQSGMTVQDDEGNGKIYYNKAGTVCYKDATVTQGHWQSMSLGNEVETSETDVKELSIDDPVVGNVYMLTVESDISHDNVMLSKNGVSLGVVN